jgi:hypothetical protein
MDERSYQIVMSLIMDEVSNHDSDKLAYFKPKDFPCGLPFWLLSRQVDTVVDQMQLCFGNILCSKFAHYGLRVSDHHIHLFVKYAFDPSENWAGFLIA